MSKRDGEKDEFSLMTDQEAAKAVASLLELDEMGAIKTMGGQMPGVPAAPVFEKSTRPKMYKRSDLVRWCDEVRKTLKPTPPAKHHDCVGKLHHPAGKVGLTDAFDYGISLSNEGTARYRG